MYKKNKLFLFVLLYCFLSFIIFATGPSYARIEIIPISVNEEGEILFKTYLHIDPQDGGAQRLIKFGFLVVNNKGKWEESYYKIYNSNTGYDNEFWNEYKNFEYIYKNNLFWDGEIEIFNKITKKYFFKKMNVKYYIKGKKVDLINMNNKFKQNGYNPYYMVKTINGFSCPLNDSKVNLIYQYKGIYLIKNVKNFFTEESTGAFFELPNYFYDKKNGFINLGYDTQSIDGIIICPE